MPVRLPYRVTKAERRALATLDRAIPRHPEDLRRRHGVRGATLWRLCLEQGDRPKLAYRLELKPACWLKAPYTPFYVLSEEGARALTAIAP